MIDKNEGDSAPFKEFTPAPFITQIWTILKIRIIHRIRNSSVWIELITSLVLLIFTVLFSRKVNTFKAEQKEAEFEIQVPLAMAPGSTPNIGIIPDTAETHVFLTLLNQTSLYPQVDLFEKTIFFNTFDDYVDYVQDNRDIDDQFIAIEVNHSSTTNDYTFRISRSGQNQYILPDTYQSVFRVYHLLNQQTPPNILFQQYSFPHKSVYSPDFENGLTACIFASVFFVGPILVTCTFFVEEADKGIRDMLTFFGLSNAASNIAWFIISFVALLFPSIFYAIALTLILHINFFTIFLLYLVESFAHSSFSLFIVSLYPKGNFATATALIILFAFFVFLFLGYFAFITVIGFDAVKNALSIFPPASYAYSMFMITSKRVTDFASAASSREYNVKYAYVYLLVEGFVYYIFYLLIDFFKNRTILPSPSKWKYSKPTFDTEPIIVDHLEKDYGKLKAVNNLSFSLKQGDVLAIVGPNGAGKSTLMSMLSASNVPTSGSIKFQSVNISDHCLTMHRLTGYCPQDNIFLNTLTPTEWLKLVCILRNEPNFDFNNLLQALGLDKQLKKRL